MSDQYWFKRRRHGYGWQPVTREGWATVGAVLVVVLGGALALVITRPEGPLPVVAYLVVVAICVAGLLAVSVRKGPTPRWRWGRSPDDDPREDH